jgi:hypothetical protein
MDHAVIAHLPLSNGDMGTEQERDVIFLLEDRLSAAIERAGVGEFDGNELGAGECVLYMYGPDADRLYDTIAPHLQMAAAARGGYAIKRYGEATDASAREVRVAW